MIVCSTCKKPVKDVMQHIRDSYYETAFTINSGSLHLDYEVYP